MSEPHGSCRSDILVSLQWTVTRHACFHARVPSTRNQSGAGARARGDELNEPGGVATSSILVGGILCIDFQAARAGRARTA